MNKQKPTDLKFKTIKEKLLIIMIALVGSASFAQVKIGNNVTIVDSSSVLELESTTKGFLPPRLTSTQRDAISAPATGLVIYNTTANSLETNIGTSISPIWSSGVIITASNGLTVSSSDMTLGGTLSSATTINQNNNDLTLTTGTGKVVVNGTLKTTGAVYGNVRKVTSFPIDWQDDDYVILLTISEEININFPPPGGTNTGRVIIIRNNSADDNGGGKTYYITESTIHGTTSSTIFPSRGHTYVSDGTAWYLVSGV